MERLGDDARRLLAAAGAPGAAGLAEITAAWPECVGDAVARAAWPSRLARDGTLHVATVSSTWAFELARLGEEVAARLRERLGQEAFGAVRFAPGPVPASGPGADDAPPVPPEVSSGSRLEGERLAASIADESLRELVARAAAASLEKARSDRGFC
jgi:hypothetical protein